MEDEDEDEDGYCYGRRARMTQGDSPVWEPLIEAVGERLVGTFMWMYEEEMADGTILHVYKHIHTRRYMHLATDGRAFAYTPCGMRLRSSTIWPRSSPRRRVTSSSDRWQSSVGARLR